MSGADDDKAIDLLREPFERVEPRPGFEARLFEALAAKQRELGRAQREPGRTGEAATQPMPATVRERFEPARPRPRGSRHSLLALAACGAAAALALAWIGGVRPPTRVAPVQTAHAPVESPAVPREDVPPQRPGTPEPPHEPQRPVGPPTNPGASSLQEVSKVLEAPAHEPLRTTLEDGSVLFLDEGARALVFGERSIWLERGRAFLEVATKLSGNTAVPFRVSSVGGDAIAHGTKLALDASEAGLAVAVAQGRVALRGRTRGEVELAPGEVGHVSRFSEPQAGASPRVSHVVSWLRELYDSGRAPLASGKAAGESKRPSPSTPLRTGFGDLVALDPQGQEAHLSVRQLHVDVHVEDGVARTTIDTTYFNHMSWRLEGTFYFPVPPGASITRLAMYIDGKLMEGGVAEREQARAAYESIVTKRRDPALLEWMEGNVFKMRIFPLEARQEKRVIVSFTQELESLYGTLRYALPLDAGKELCRDFSVAMRWKNAAGSSAASPTYALSQTREGDDLLLGFEQADAAPKKDLVVYVSDRPLASTVPAPPPPTTGSDEAGHRFVLARFRPELGSSARRGHGQGRHFVVLYDASGSRSALELEVQREVLARLLAELDDGDRVKVVAVNARARGWKLDWSEARKSADAALAFVDSTRAIGGTDLGAGLIAAARCLEGVPNGTVVYLGDGIATLGERDPRKLAALLPAATEFVGVGVGKRVDSAALEALAGATGGTCALVGADEPIAWRVFDLVAALSTPRVVALDVAALDQSGHTVPGSVHLSRTVAAAGEEVRVVGRFDKELPARLVLTGRLGGQPFSQELSLAGARDGASYLPRLWARGRVERLLREGAEKNKAEITALGKESFIATPFTSLLVLENDEMYTQLKVERGKPDSFAFYATPARIEVKTEPLAGPGSVASSGEPRWKNPRDFAASIACRNQGVAYDSYRGSYLGVDPIDPLVDLPMDKPDYRAVRLGLYPARYDGQLTFNVITRAGISVEGEYRGFIDRTGWLDYGSMRELSSTTLVDQVIGRGMKMGYYFNDSRSWDDVPWVTDMAASGPLGGNTIPLGDRGLAFSEPVDLFWFATANPTGTTSGDRFFSGADPTTGFAMPHPFFAGAAGGWLDVANAKKSAKSLDYFYTPYAELAERGTGFDLVERLARGPYAWASGVTLNQDVPNDLSLLVPGLHASRADVLALAELELTHDPAPVGHHDADALKLLERARAAFGWRSFKLEGPAGFEGVAAGDGRFTLRRRLPTGLEEKLFVDGQSIVNVYEELGIATRRPLSRFHAGSLQALVPFLPPTASALEGWDARASGRTVTLTPATLPTKDDAKPQEPWVRVELDFAEDGRFVERRLLCREERVAGKPEWVVESRLTIADAKLTLQLEGEKARDVALVCTPIDRTILPPVAPTLEGLVVVDVPVRTVAFTQEKLSALGDKTSAESERLQDQLVASRLFEGQFDWSALKARIAKRPSVGLLVLGGHYANDVVEAVAKDHEGSPLVRYYRLLADQDHARRLETISALAHDHPEGVIATFARWLAFQDALQLTYSNSNDAKLREQALNLAVACAGETRFALLVHEVARQAQNLGNYRPEDANKVLAIYERAVDIGGSFGVRYEAAQYLANRGRWAEAAPRFVALYDEAMGCGAFPPFDWSLVQAIQQGQGGTPARFEAFVQRALGWAEETKNAEALISLAWSLHQTNNTALAERALRGLPGVVSEESKDSLRAVLARLWETWGEPARAEVCIRELLAKPSLEKTAWLHEYAATLAERQGKLSLAIADYERAFALESEDLRSEVVNLAAFRQRYVRLLALYTTLAKATYVPGAPSRSLAEDILAAADRWRAVDGENPAVDTQVAQALLACGADDDAWDVASNEIERHPAEGVGYVQVAGVYAAENRLELALHLYEQAAALEPTDPTPLLEAAKVLERQGEPGKARALYERIAGATWQDRFAGVVQQAKAAVGK